MEVDSNVLSNGRRMSDSVGWRFELAGFYEYM